MKKILLTYSLILFMSFAAFGQTFTVYPSPAYVSGDPSEAYIEAIAYVENNTSNDITLRWERVVENLPNGWASSVCDNSQCYIPQVYLMDFTIEAGDDGLLDVRFYPDGMEGSGDVEILIYDPLDSLNTVFSNKYFGEALLTSVEEPEAENFNIYPNPANNYVILPDNRNIQQAVIYNIAGRKIQIVEMNGLEARVDIGHFMPGLYLVQFLDENGVKLHTGRLTKR